MAARWEGIGRMELEGPIDTCETWQGLRGDQNGNSAVVRAALLHRYRTETEVMHSFSGNATAAQKIVRQQAGSSTTWAQKQEQDGVFPIPVSVSLGNLRQSHSSPRVTLNYNVLVSSRPNLITVARATSGFSYVFPHSLSSLIKWTNQ